MPFQFFLKDLLSTVNHAIPLKFRKSLHKGFGLLPTPRDKSEEHILRTISKAMNKNGHSLYNLLVVFRMLRKYAELTGENFQGQRVLEIGSSKDPSLPLIFLLAGCRHYSANNVLPINRSLSNSSVNLIYLIMSGLMDINKTRLEEVVNWSTADGKRYATLQPEFYSELSTLPAEEIAIPNNSIDAVFSISVLEHVCQPSLVLKNTFRILRPGGWFCHTIDLRDHTKLKHPLEFLKYSHEEYLSKTAATENRLRAADFLKLFKEVGFVIEQMRFRDRPFVLENAHHTDTVAAMLQSFEQLAPRHSIEEIKPWVTEDERKSFHPDFHSNSLKDLSALVMVVIGRKQLVGKV